MGKPIKKNKKMNMSEIPVVLLDTTGFNPHGLTVEEMHYVDGLIHIAKTKEQINLIAYLYDRIESLTEEGEKKAYMDRLFRELEIRKGYSDDKLRTSVVSKLTGADLKQLICI